jgi:sugar phosphate permease
MGVPAWNSLLIESFPEERRGKEISKIAYWGSIGSIISVLVIGFLLTEEYTIWEDVLPNGVLTTFGDRSRFLIPIILLLVMSTIGVLSLLRYPDTGKYVPLKGKNTNGRIANLKLGFSELKEHKFFTFFLIISFAHAFAMSMSWGLFPQRQRGDAVNGGLEATFMEIAVLQVIFSFTTLFLVGPGGRFSDKVGRDKLIKINRFSLVIFPFWYAFSSSVYELAISHIIVGSILAFSQAALIAYLFDIVPNDKRGVYFGVYNSFLGIAYFFGSISGGYLVNLFEYLNYSTAEALKSAFIVVGFVRLIVAFLFLSLKDVRPFPSTFSKEVELLFSKTGSDGDTH